MKKYSRLSSAAVVIGALRLKLVYKIINSPGPDGIILVWVSSVYSDSSLQKGKIITIRPPALCFFKVKQIFQRDMNLTDCLSTYMDFLVDKT